MTACLPFMGEVVIDRESRVMGAIARVSETRLASHELQRSRFNVLRVGRQFKERERSQQTGSAQTNGPLCGGTSAGSQRE